MSKQESDSFSKRICVLCGKETDDFDLNRRQCNDCLRRRANELKRLRRRLSPSQYQKRKWAPGQRKRVMNPGFAQTMGEFGEGTSSDEG